MGLAVEKLYKRFNEEPVAAADCSQVPGSGLDAWRNMYSAVRAKTTSDNRFIMENLQFQMANWQTKGISQNHKFKN